MANKYRLHHSAMARGYKCKGEVDKVAYKGRFGEGFVLHYPTVDYHGRRACGNLYHIIEYFVLDE